MAVFFIYDPTGEGFSRADMEYSPNAEVPKRELADRVRTGEGFSCYVSRLDELNYRSACKARRREEWEPATDQARMAVWRLRGKGLHPTGPPTEVWQYSGNVDRPTITPWAEDAPSSSPPAAMRVPEDVYRTRLALGWDEERARTTPLSQRYSPMTHLAETEKR